MPKYPDIKVYVTNRDGKIDDATYNAKRTELTETLDELHKKENLHRTADDNVNDTIINLFRAAQHISDNFIKSSEVATKRTILKLIFRTLQLKDTTLCYDLNFPFNVLYKNTENNKWRGMNTVRFHTYKFQFYREFTGIFPL